MKDKNMLIAIWKNLVLSQLPLLLQDRSNLGVKATLHIGMVEQVVESVMIAHKNNVQEPVSVSRVILEF